MSGSRALGRWLVVPRALGRRLAARSRARPAAPSRILIVHHLLLGDTLCLTPLLAKCREQYPQTDIALTVPRSAAPLYAQRPYGVRPLAFDPENSASVGALLREAPFDLALVPGENRFAWIAHALGALWVAGFDGDRPAYKNRLLDERLPFPSWPWNWGDVAASLIPGPPSKAYSPSDWQAPDWAPFERPAGPYAVLHLGARNPLRLWQGAKWRALCEALEKRGLEIAWSGARADEALVREVDPQGRRRSYAGRLDLAQLWHLLAGARLLVCPDTGIAHLARIVGVPAVTLFGPGSVALSGAGAFWASSPYRAVTVEAVPCRDQRLVFKREIPGMRRCVRFPPECTNNICMQEIGLEPVLAAADELLAG